MQSRGKWRAIAVAVFMCHWGYCRALAAVYEEIEASASYRLGDDDTRIDGRRLALLAAKRNALEKAGTYVEGITEIQSFHLTKDQIRTLAAGILEVSEMREHWEQARATVVVTMWVKVRVDRDSTVRHIDALRRNADALEVLEEARVRVATYEKEIAALKGELASSQPDSRAALLESRRRAVTNVEAAGLVARAEVALSGQDDADAPVRAGTLSWEQAAKASIWYEEALAIDPENPDALAGLAAIEGDPVRAEVFARRAIGRDPGHARAFAVLGFALANQRKVDEGIAAMRKAIAIKPAFAAVHANLGFLLHHAKGDRNAAAAEYREALRLMPEFSTARSNLGALLLEHGQLSEAEAELREAIRRDPSFGSPHRFLGEVLSRRGDEAGAAREYGEACRLGLQGACGKVWPAVESKASPSGCSRTSRAARRSDALTLGEGADVLIVLAGTLFGLKRSVRAGRAARSSVE